MTEETYKTSDLYLASYLLFRGRKLISIKKANIKRNMFVFMGDCEDEVDEFFNGEGKQFLAYAQALRDLKSMMYASESSMEADGTVNPENLRKDYKI